jgi:hypothetical protein
MIEKQRPDGDAVSDWSGDGQIAAVARLASNLAGVVGHALAQRRDGLVEGIMILLLLNNEAHSLAVQHRQPRSRFAVIRLFVAV